MCLSEARTSTRCRASLHLGRVSAQTAPVHRVLGRWVLGRTGQRRAVRRHRPPREASCRHPSSAGAPARQPVRRCSLRGSATAPMACAATRPGAAPRRSVVTTTDTRSCEPSGSASSTTRSRLSGALDAVAASHQARRTGISTTTVQLVAVSTSAHRARCATAAQVDASERLLPGDAPCSREGVGGTPSAGEERYRRGDERAMPRI